MKITTNYLTAVVLMLSMAVPVFAQNGYQVKTVVTDPSGVAVIGASVVEENTANGASTDLDGNASFRASSPNVTIVVSCIGYTTQSFKASQVPAVIRLAEDTEFLDDVVVIGYGSVKKSDLTGAITAIKPDAKNKVKMTAATDLMLGKISGLQIIQGSGSVGSEATIRIRQGASLNASNEPLIVIDGMPDGSLSSLNAEDIESISVLKDASSTAIYGARGANGVIMVTTKKGPENTGGKTIAPKVNYRGDLSLNYNYEKLDVYDPDEFRAEYAKRGWDTSLLGDASTDWVDEITRTAFNQKHTVTLRGALPYTPYRVSLGYQGDRGYVIGNKRETGTLSANFNPTLMDGHILIDAGVKANWNYTPASGGSIISAAKLDPTQPVYGDYGSVTVNGVNYDKKAFGYYMLGADSNGDNALPQFSNIAASVMYPGTGHTTRSRLMTNLSVAYKVHGIKGLTAKVSFNSSFGKNDTVTRGQDNTPSTWMPSYVNKGKGGIATNSESTSDNSRYNIDYLLSYNNKFGIHSIDATVGHTYESYKYESWDGQTFYNDGTLMDGSYESTSKSQVNLSSYLARVNYGLADKYLFTFAMRADASSRFAPETRWGFFPSGAFAWKINEEDFLKGAESVSQLKLRLSYGQTGQQEINNDYAYQAFYYQSIESCRYKDGDTAYDTYMPTAYNRAIQWEVTTTYNAGIDYGFFNDRLSGALDVYYRYTDNLLMSDVKVAAGSNFTDVLDQNIGEMSSKGLEFSVSAVPVSTKDWNWSVNANISFNSSTIESLTAYEDSEAYVKTGGVDNNRYVQVHKVGYTPYSYYLAQQVYDEDGNPLEKFYNPAYDPSDPSSSQYLSSDQSDAARVVSDKSSLSPVYGGFSTQLTYKNWDLGMNAHYALGHYVFWGTMYGGSNGSFYEATSGAVTNTFKDVAPYWSSEHYYSDHWLYKGDYLKLDNIVLGYTFNDIRNWMSTARVSLGLQNLYTFTRYPGLDPEVYSGIDKSSTPRPRMVMLSFDVTF